MGNCSTSEQHAKLFRTENFSNDPTAFRVFIKKRNKKFVPGWLKVNDEEIIFSRGQHNFQFWPLAYLRRYGYTCSDIFFFESGRRCATGEGLHTFQSHQAERIFHLVQSKIKIEEYTRGSRASSVVSNRATGNAINPSLTNRIHPVQRFSSEGANNDFLLSANSNQAPPSYGNYQRNLQDCSARRYDGNCNINTMDRRRRLPSVSSSHSVSVRGSGGYTRERPRSVVSAIGHSTCNNNVPVQMPNSMNQSPSSIQSHLLPSSASMAGSYSSCLMNQSYNSTLCGGSPWPSQQQLEGEIVLEHVLSERQRQQPSQYREPTCMDVPTARQRKYHSYVNVDLMPRSRGELHRTNNTRQEFLSSQPGGFSYGNTNQPQQAPSVPIRTLSVGSAASTVTTPLPLSLSPPESFRLNINRQQGFCLYNGRPKQSDTMSTSATAALNIPSPNEEQPNFFDSSRTRTLPLRTKQNYITVAVGRQEQTMEHQQNGRMKNGNITGVGKQLGLNYALIDFDKTKTLAGMEKTAQHEQNDNYH